MRQARRLPRWREIVLGAPKLRNICGRQMEPEKCFRSAVLPMLMGNRTDGGHLNEDCSDRTADRKRSTNLIWWKRTRRVVFDRGAGQAGAPGHAFRKWRFTDLRRARP